MRSYFDQIDLENTIQMWPKQVSEAPTALLLTAKEARTPAGGRHLVARSSTWTASSTGRRWSSVLVWLVLLELLGLVAFPLAFVVLRGLADRGYGVSKTLGMLLLAWLSWFGPSLKLVPYQRWWIALCLGLLIGAVGGRSPGGAARLIARLRPRARARCS